MKGIASVLGALSIAIGGVVIRPFNTYQGFMLKSTATAQTPALMMIGATAAALGLKQRSWLATMGGAFGSAIGVAYIARTTTPHNGLERAFGANWRERIDPAVEHRMLQRRRTWRLPATPVPGWTRDVTFGTISGSERQLLADIWEPPDGVDRSGIAIVYLYGGSWHFFDKDVLTRPFFRQLAAQGHLVMDAGHRSAPETDIRGMVGDVHRAVAWIKENAGKYGVDPEKVVVMGGSSGAHIALLAAYAPEDPRLKPEELQGVDTTVMAVVSYYGIPDMRLLYLRAASQEASAPTRPALPRGERKEPGRFANGMNRLVFGRALTARQSPPADPLDQMMRNLLGGLPDDVPAMTRLASPSEHVSASNPPTLIFQGTHDAVVPLQSARDLARALEEAGVSVMYVEFPWAEHAFDLMYPPLANPAAKAALYDLERFLVCVAYEQRPGADRAGVAPGRETQGEAVLTAG